MVVHRPEVPNICYLTSNKIDYRNNSIPLSIWFCPLACDIFTLVLVQDFCSNISIVFSFDSRIELRPMQIRQQKIEFYCCCFLFVYVSIDTGEWAIKLLDTSRIEISYEQYFNNPRGWFPLSSGRPLVQQHRQIDFVSSYNCCAVASISIDKFIFYWKIDLSYELVHAEFD